MAKNLQDTRQYKSGRIDSYALTHQGIQKDRSELKKELERKRARDSELVVIKFKNLETPGGVLRFTYKRYAQDQFQKYEFFDGDIYQVPRGVRDHIAKGCYSVVYTPLQGTGPEGQFAVQSGSMHNQYSNTRMSASKKKFRFQALGLDYMDDDLEISGPEITQVSLSVDAKSK